MNPKSSSLPKVVVKYVNKGEEESLKSVTADLNFAVDDIWWRNILQLALYTSGLTYKANCVIKNQLPPDRKINIIKEGET